MKQETIILPQNSNGSGYRLTEMVHKRRFLSYLRDRWWVVLICLVLALGTVLTVETTRTDTYSSYAELLVGDVHVNMGNLFTEDTANYFGTQIELLKSSHLQNAAWESVNQGGNAAGSKLPSLEVVRPMGTSILQLQAVGPDPGLTQRFLQALIDEYKSFKRASRDLTSEDVVRTLTKELDDKKDTLKTEEDNWLKFQKTNNLTVMEAEGKTASSMLAKYELELGQLEFERNLLQQQIKAAEETAAVSSNVVRATVESAQGTNSLASPESAPETNAVEVSETNAPGGGQLPVVSEATNSSSSLESPELKAARHRLTVLLSDLSGKKTLQKQDKTRLADAEKQVAIFEDENRAQLQIRLKDLTNNMQAIEAALPYWAKKELELDDRRSQNQRLESSFRLAQDDYNRLLANLKSVDLSRNVQSDQLSVYQAPTPAQITRRSLPLRIFLALAAGLGVSVLIVFAWHLLDDRFASFLDVREQFGEEILGLVPQIRVRKSKPQQALLLDRDARHAYLESFRYLRSALLLSAGVERRSQTLLVTGVAPKEGKTTIAVNLARTLARSGLRVVLVDADVHVAGIHRLIGGPEQLGLLDYLRGDADASAIMQPTDVPGLTYIPSGTHPHQAEGLFLHPRLVGLMQELKAANDFVILDGAPVLGADDSALLVPHADSVVMVVRPYFTRSGQLRQALSMLYQRQARQVSLILNQARADDFGGKYARNGRLDVRKNGAASNGNGTRPDHKVSV